MQRVSLNMEDPVMVADVELRDSKTNEVNLEVLHPENPLMIRFQKALKHQLENKLESIRSDVLQSEGEIKKVRTESENVSEILFAQKCEVSKMEKTLYKYNETVSNLIGQKELVRNELNELKKTQTNEMTKCNNESKLNTEFRRKVNIQRHVLTELQNYDRLRVSNLSIKRNSVMKNRTDKEAKLHEKDEQDYLLMRLENQVFKFNLLIQDYENQLKAKCEERAILREKLEAKYTKFTNLSQENSRLLKLWKNVVFMVSERDEKCTRLKIELEKDEVAHKTKIARLNSYKQDANEEIFRNETIIANRNKKQKMLGQLKHQHSNFIQTERTIENELLEVTGMSDGTRKSLNLSLEECVLHKHTLSMMEVRLRNLSSKKIELEDRILSQLHNELLSSNMSTKLNDEIRKLRNTTKQQEMIVEELQEDYANKMVYLEKQKMLLDSDYELLRNARVEIDTLNGNVSDDEEKLSKLKLHVKQQNYGLDMEMRRLYDLEKEPVQDSDLLKKRSFVKEKLKEIHKTIESEKRVWIRKQNEAMQMIEKKTALTVELNSVQSYVHILQQKALRLNQNMMKEERDHGDLNKTISQILRRISSLNNEYSNRKESETLMDNKTCAVQSTVMEKLKLAEIDSMQLVQEIKKLGEKREALEEELLNSGQENMEWQKKVQQSHEMKESISKELSENGDIGAMKNEIHRMEIRYAQLKRAQDSLVSDLENSVHKRDRVMDAVITKEKIPSDDAFARSQRLISQKIEIIENKNRTLLKKIEEFQSKCENLSADRSGMVLGIEERQRSTNKLQDAIQEMENKIFEYSALKQKNLEILIRKQRMADFLSRIKSDKMKSTLPSEFVIEKTFAKHRFMQNDLKEVLENLRKDFPTLVNHIIRIVNILNSLPSVK